MHRRLLSAARGLALALACLLAASGCTHTYIFDRASAPKVSDGSLEVRDAASGETRREPIVFVSLRRPGSPEDRWEAASLDEYDYFTRRGHLPQTEALQVETSTTRTVWRVYGLAGFGVGLGAGFVTSGLVAVGDPGSAMDYMLSIPILTAVVGLFIGAIIGAPMTSGTTDLRTGRIDAALGDRTD